MVIGIGPQNPFSENLHSEKYRADGESYDDYCIRYSRATSDGEDHFRQLLGATRAMRLLPAGRQQRAVGTPHLVTAFNCFVGEEVEDSMKGIMDALTRGAATMRAGGGKGWNFSALRPEGEPVRGLGEGARSSGPISFMGMWDAMCKTITSGGGRRGAMMGVMDISHPDIRKFVHAKRIPPEMQALWDAVEAMPNSTMRTSAALALQNTLRLTAFNISVGVDDAFMEAVKSDGLYALKFKGQNYDTIRALDLWSEIMENNWDWAEPGILFLERINKMNPLSYCEVIRATNPCFTGDTRILTAEGYVRLDEAADRGEEVMAWDGDQFVSVLPRVTAFNQKVLRVTLSNGVELECTPYHRFKMADGTVVEARDLQIDDALAKFEMPVIEGGVPHPEAYTQGFFSGDGWINHPDRDSSSAILGLYGDKRALLEQNRFTGVTGSSAIGGDRTYVYIEGGHLVQDKGFVPSTDWDVASRLAWFAGLCDADGTVLDYGTSKSIQVCSIDRDFLLAVRLLLTTLGVDEATVAVAKEATTRMLKNGSGGVEEYDCQTLYRLSVSPWQLAKLQRLGAQFGRLDVSGNRPSRNAARFTRVLKVEDEGKVVDRVYCYTNPVTSRGCFEGVVTMNCGEQPLPANGACLLGSLNLVRYLVDNRSRIPKVTGGEPNVVPFAAFEIDYELLKADLRAAVRAFDNVIDRTVYPLPEQEAEAKQKRRMGVGLTGVANALETMGFPYGSDAYIRQQEKVLHFVLNTCYRASIELAREKGSFPLFDAEKWLAGGFAQSGVLDDDVIHGIRTVGLRNGLLTSYAPTGTISLAADNVSSSIEPVFLTEQRRTVLMSDGKVEVDLNDYAYQHYGTIPVTADQVSPRDHVRVLCSVQKYTDSSVSKTVNVKGKVGGKGPGITFEEFKDLYMQAYDGGAKGCTTFNSNGKRLGILRAREEVKEELASTGTDGQACFYDPKTGMRSCE